MYATFWIKEETKFLFLINIFKFLNSFKDRPISAAGNIEVSENTDEFKLNTKTDNQLNYALKLLNGW